MTAIAYASPFVPVEWIVAHGLKPRWVRLSAPAGRALAMIPRGVCPYAGALVEQALSGMEASALVLTTACDQMRYAAALIESRGGCPVFLMNVPSTWQTPLAGKMYLEELFRLGRFLIALGGSAPEETALVEGMSAYDRSRQSLQSIRDKFSARQFAEAIVAVRESVAGASRVTRLERAWKERCIAATPFQGVSPDVPTAGVPLAIVGGPLWESDYALYDFVEELGGRIVLDATEGGQRTLPRRFDPVRMASAPVLELADAYFDAIPDAFRRPNERLYQWLGRELADRQVRGILLRRYVWCDTWHAEAQRLKQWSGLPVLELDVGPDSTMSRPARGRMEAFLETLR